MILILASIFTYAIPVTAAADMTNSTYSNNIINIESNDCPFNNIEIVNVVPADNCISNFLEYKYCLAKININRSSSKYMYIKRNKYKVVYKGIVGDIDRNNIIDINDLNILKYYIYKTNNYPIESKLINSINTNKIIYNQDNNKIDPVFDINRDNIINVFDIIEFESYLNNRSSNNNVGRLIVSSRLYWTEIDPMTNTVSSFYTDSSYGYIPSNAPIQKVNY